MHSISSFANVDVFSRCFEYPVLISRYGGRLLILTHDETACQLLYSTDNIFIFELLSCIPPLTLKYKVQGLAPVQGTENNKQFPGTESEP